MSFASGTQINPIPSINEVRGANNTILQNRYNYNGAAAMYHWNKYKNRGR